MASKKHGHHGGAWKVAYADFVTAMMALFLVLWLTAQDTKLKEAVQRAFRNPFGALTKESVGILPSTNEPASDGSRGSFDAASFIEMHVLRRITEELLKTLETEDDPARKSVEVELTPEGVRVTIFDRSQRPIFENQSIRFTPYGDWVVSTLAWSISRYPSFNIDVEGHTERGHPPVNEQYGAWELSADRANAARRKLLEHGVGASQIRKVAGFADTQPIPTRAPEEESNRRVSVMLKAKSGSRA